MPEEAECLVTPESFAEKQAKRQQDNGMNIEFGRIGGRIRVWSLHQHPQTLV